MKNILSLILVVISISACGAKTTLIRHSASYEEALSHSRQTAIITPSVEAKTLDAAGKMTRNYDYEDVMEDIIADVLYNKLRSKGYNVKIITRRDVHNKKLSSAISRFRDSYQGDIGKLYNPLLMEEKKAFEIEAFVEDTPKKFNEHLDADLVAIVDYFFRNKTSGANKKDVAVAVLGAMAGVRTTGSPEDEAAELARIRLALLDAKSGQIVWSNYRQDTYGSFSWGRSSLEDFERKRLDKVLTELLAPLPNYKGS